MSAGFSPESLRAQVQAYYEAYLPAFERDLVAQDAALARLCTVLDAVLRPEDTVLDLGCGIGLFTRQLVSRVPQGHVVGVDLSPVLIDKARLLCGAEFMVGDATSLRLNRTFSLITLVDVLEHIPQEEYAALWETLSLHAAPSATILFRIPDPEAIRVLVEAGKAPERPGVASAISLDRLHREAYRAGFCASHILEDAGAPEGAGLIALFTAVGQSGRIRLEDLQAVPATSESRPAVVTSETRSAPTGDFVRVGFWTADPHHLEGIEHVLEALPERYHVMHFGTGGHVSDILEDLSTVDMAWFEGTTGPLVKAAPFLGHVPTMVRMHLTDLHNEAFSDVVWEHVDTLVYPSDVARLQHELLYRHTYSARSERYILPDALVPDAWPLDPSRKRNTNVAWVGRFTFENNLSLLMQIIKATVDEEPRMQFHLVGQVEHLGAGRYLNQQIERLGLKHNVHIYDNLTSLERPQLYAQCGALLVTASDTRSTLPVLEAMLCGTKPVVHAVEGVDELFGPVSMFGSVAEAVDHLLRGAYAPSVYARFVRANYDARERGIEMTQILDRTLAVYYPDYVSGRLRTSPTIAGSEAEERYDKARRKAQEGLMESAAALLEGVDFADFPMPKRVHAHLLALQVALVQGHVSDALHHADVATDLAPEEPAVLNLAGRAMWAGGFERNAFETLVYAAELVESNALTFSLPYDKAAIFADAAEACHHFGKPDVAARFTL